MPTEDTLQALRPHAEEFIAIRRDIHQNPELSFKEQRTSDLVAERLQDWGYHVTRGLGGTGLVGQLQRGSGTRTLGLRAAAVDLFADIDGNPDRIAVIEVNSNPSIRLLE